MNINPATIKKAKAAVGAAAALLPALTGATAEASQGHHGKHVTHHHAAGQGRLQGSFTPGMKSLNEFVGYLKANPKALQEYATLYQASPGDVLHHFESNVYFKKLTATHKVVEYYFENGKFHSKEKVLHPGHPVLSNKDKGQLEVDMSCGNALNLPLINQKTIKKEITHETIKEKLVPVAGKDTVTFVPAGTFLGNTYVFNGDNFTSVPEKENDNGLLFLAGGVAIGSLFGNHGGSTTVENEFCPPPVVVVGPPGPPGPSGPPVICPPPVTPAPAVPEASTGLDIVVGGLVLAFVAFFQRMFKKKEPQLPETPPTV